MHANALYNYPGMHACGMVDISTHDSIGPEPIVYVYDDRGLRVPQRGGSSHMRSGSTPAAMMGATEQITTVCKSQEIVSYCRDYSMCL